MTHFLREEYAEALPQFTRAADLRPEVPLYRANKAAALGMLGRSQEARMEYRQFLRPTDADENVDILNRARRHRRVPATPAAIERREAEGAAQPHAPIAAQP
jgi:tetratricopeptide (TPR) repeat protein